MTTAVLALRYSLGAVLIPVAGVLLWQDGVDRVRRGRRIEPDWFAFAAFKNEAPGWRGWVGATVLILGLFVLFG